MFLPILLRSLVPVGFMPMIGPDHSVRLIICDGYAQMPRDAAKHAQDMPAGMPADMAMGGPMGPSHSPGGHPLHQDHGSCPYGASPALGTLPALANLSAQAERSSDPIVPSAQIGHFEVSFRAQSPRGPPA